MEDDVEIEVGMAASEVVGPSATIVSNDAMRSIAITNALKGQGVEVTGPKLGSPQVATFNASAVGNFDVRSSAVTVTGPRPSNNMV